MVLKLGVYGLERGVGEERGKWVCVGVGWRMIDVQWSPIPFPERSNFESTDKAR